MKQILINEVGIMQKVKIGFSWTTFFFGPFVPLVRGDIKYFFIMIIASFLTFGISNIIFAFLYNKFYINDLLNKGYKFYNFNLNV